MIQECAKWFIDSKDRARQAMSSLLVDILMPVGAVIDLEASLPAVKKFVALLFNHCFEQCRKVKHHAVSIVWLHYHVDTPPKYVVLFIVDLHSLGHCYPIYL